MIDETSQTNCCRETIFDCSPSLSAEFGFIAPELPQAVWSSA